MCRQITFVLDDDPYNPYFMWYLEQLKAGHGPTAKSAACRSPVRMAAGTNGLPNRYQVQFSILDRKFASVALEPAHLDTFLNGVTADEPPTYKHFNGAAYGRKFRFANALSGTSISSLRNALNRSVVSSRSASGPPSLPSTRAPSTTTGSSSCCLPRKSKTGWLR